MGTSDPERWVFGYGSLMWRPGFPFLERRRAVCHGRRRAFCIYSVHHRGTPQRKGLVLGLAHGGSVRGAAYRVAEADWPATYVEHWAPARLDGGALVRALTFVSDRSHPQWAGDLCLEAQADLIAGASGLSGRNVDYLTDLVEHLRAEGVRDHSMERLLQLVLEREARLAAE